MHGADIDGTFIPARAVVTISVLGRRSGYTNPPASSNEECAVYVGLVSGGGVCVSTPSKDRAYQEQVRLLVIAAFGFKVNARAQTVGDGEPVGDGSSAD